MPNALKIDLKERDISTSLRDVLKTLLTNNSVEAIFAQRKLPYKHAFMPTLISDPEKLDGIDTIAPAFPLNSARMVSRLSGKSIGGTIAVVLRPCEIRAFVELLKLHQARREEIVIIGFDCPGAFSNRDYAKFAEANAEESTRIFLENVLKAGKPGVEDFRITPACMACDHPVPDNADIRILFFGMDLDSHFFMEAMTPAGEKCMDVFEHLQEAEAENRDQAVSAMLTEKKKYRDEMFRSTTERMGDIEKISEYFADCVNCFNCRVSCPVCYCRECVFVTDTFNHEPYQYLNWARRKGAVKIPTDTVFYHMTRLAHMSLACVGCGQCSNACPNDIPVMEIFRTVAHRTQEAFGYEAGRSEDEAPPLSEFRENEFNEVVGIGGTV